MSAEFIKLFFPDLWSAAEKHGLRQRIAPDETQLACPAVRTVLPGGIILRWAALAPLASLGVLIGLVGVILILQRQKFPWRLSGVPGAAWAFSFAWFAVMNTSALVCHNLLEPYMMTHDSVSQQLSRVFRAWVALDVAATGAASFCGLMAAVLSYASLRAQQQATQASKQEGLNSTKGEGGSPTKGSYSTIVSMNSACICMVCFSLSNNINPEQARIHWANEAIYIGMTLVALPIVATYLRAELRNPELPRLARRGIHLAFLGALLGPMGSPLDKYMCMLVGSHFTHAHVLFLACDIIYAGLLTFLLNM